MTNKKPQQGEEPRDEVKKKTEEPKKSPTEKEIAPFVDIPIEGQRMVDNLYVRNLYSADDKTQAYLVDSACRVYRSSDQSISGSNVTIQYDAEDFDLNDEFDSSTNYRFTAGQDGYYLVAAQVSFAANADETYDVHIFKNGSEISRGRRVSPVVKDYCPVNVVDVVSLSEDDYIEIKASEYETGSVTVEDGSEWTWLAIFRLF